MCYNTGEILPEQNEGTRPLGQMKRCSWDYYLLMDYCLSIGYIHGSPIRCFFGWNYS
jgi:hypothetical protein